MDEDLFCSVYASDLQKVVNFTFADMYNTVYSYSLVLWHKQYIIQHCCICCPSDSSMSEDAEIEPSTVATSALTFRCRNHTIRSHPHSVRSHPPLGIIYVDTKTIQFLYWSFKNLTFYTQYIFYHPARNWGGEGMYDTVRIQQQS